VPLPIKKILCANRGEIAIRIFRAATELGLSTVAVYSHQDRVHLHRYKADEAYLVGKGKSAVASLPRDRRDRRVAVEARRRRHPSGLWLPVGERRVRAEACAKVGIAFVGPSADVLRTFGDKTAARSLAKKIGVSMVPGSDGPVRTVEDARAFVASGRGSR
jgi:pyruvate carboxylase